MQTAVGAMRRAVGGRGGGRRVEQRLSDQGNQQERQKNTLHRVTLIFQSPDLLTDHAAETCLAKAFFRTLSLSTIPDANSSVPALGKYKVLAIVLRPNPEDTLAPAYPVVARLQVLG
jgi:hypothetical protein